MYTNLSHDEIIKAVHWMCDLFKKNYRGKKKIVSIPKSEKLPARVGFSYDFESFNRLDMKDILNIVKFDLNNTMFTIGNIILKQKKGIPMGSPLSPVLAILVCAYYEHKFMHSLNNLATRISGVRYIDDVTVIIAYNKNDPFSKLKALSIKTDFLNDCYHKDLILKEELVCDNQFNFLDLSISHNGNNFVCNYLNKNKLSIRFGHQKFFRYHHAFSMCPKSSKKGVAMSVLYRIANSSTSQFHFENSVKDLFTELKSLHYTKKFICSLILTMIDRCKKWTWTQLLHFVKCSWEKL